MYHIYLEGQRITSEPITLEIVNQLYGSVKAIERLGFRLIKVK